MKYTLGRGNWAESAMVGILSLPLIAVMMVLVLPALIISGVVIFIAGITGFLKRED